MSVAYIVYLHWLICFYIWTEVQLPRWVKYTV